MDAKEHHLAEYEKARGSLPGFSKLRGEAACRFAGLGFPTGREEEWRFTDVTPLTEIPFRPPSGTANPNQVAGLARGPLKDCQIAFVDGGHAPAFSSKEMPDGVTVTNLREPAERLGGLGSTERNPFVALNTASWSDGAHVRVRKGATVERPIHLLFLSSFRGDPYMTHPRILVEVEEGAKATIVESYLGPAGGTYFTNAVTEVVCADGASVDYVKVQRESRDAFHVATFQATQGRDTTLTHVSISLGGRISRNDLGSVLDGEGAECTMNGLYEVAGEQLCDHHTTLDHARPHGTSRELYKGILSGAARGVFDGRIIVRPDAQKTNAVQSNRNLLLSDRALVNTKPQLEIFADDVKCRHGATIGQLDDDVLFYLRSRGIGLEEARRLLVHAFASEIVDRVKIDAVRAQLGGCLGLILGAA